MKEELSKEGVHDLTFEGQFDSVGFMRNIGDRLGFEKMDTVIRHLKVRKLEIKVIIFDLYYLRIGFKSIKYVCLGCHQDLKA